MAELEDQQSLPENEIPNQALDATVGTQPKAATNNIQPKTSSSNIPQNLSQREKETLILHELSTTINTMQQISSVLEDVVYMTSKAKDSKEQASAQNKNILAKQKALLEELTKWHRG